MRTRAFVSMVPPRWISSTSSINDSTSTPSSFRISSITRSWCEALSRKIWMSRILCCPSTPTMRMSPSWQCSCAIAERTAASMPGRSPVRTRTETIREALYRSYQFGEDSMCISARDAT